MADPKELNTWKEVATYLGRGVRTVQDWERKQGLPIRRLGESGRIVATTTELDAWKATRLVSRQNPITTGDEDASVAVSVESLETTQDSIRRARHRTWVVTTITFVAVGGLAVIAGRRWLEPASQLDHFIVEQRLLTVFNANNGKLWDYTFPQPITSARVSETHDSVVLKHKLLTQDATTTPGLAFASADTVYYFTTTGKIAWMYKPGRQLTDQNGSIIPANYFVSFVRAFNSPRPDGGQIIVGAHRGPSALFVVELLTSGGRKVAEYFHYGWFFTAQTGVLGRDGQEYLFLGGVDDITNKDSDYGATLVVLAPGHMDGQAATLAGDRRALRGVPPAEEKAVLLIKEFARTSDPYAFCRAEKIDASSGRLDLYVSKGGSRSGAHFEFDERLNLRNVQSNGELLQLLRPTLLKDVAPAAWPEVLKSSLGDVRYVRSF